MRVLVIVHGFPPSGEGGAEVYAHAHARALRRAGDDVLVLTREQDVSAPEYRIRREERDGLQVVWVNNTFRNTRTFEESYRNPAIAAIARDLVREFKPDIAHVHHLTCLSTDIIGVLNEHAVPSIFTLHDYWLICHRGQLLDLAYRVCDGPGPSGCANCLGVAGSGGAAASAVRGLLRHLPARPAQALRTMASRAASTWQRPGTGSDEALRRVDHMRAVAAGVTHFLAPSRYLRDRFVQFGVPADRITTVDLGLEHEPFGARASDRTTSSRLRLGFLGTMMVSKAPHILLEAASRLPCGSASVDLFGAYSAYHGDDSYRARLDPLLTADGVRAHGAVDHGRVVEALKSIDVLVVPSIWPENSPLVIREAFLAGVPVVASNIGGIPEAVKDGRNGLLFCAGDVDDLHRVLARFLNEPDLLSKLRAGIGRVQTIEEDVRLTRHLYDSHVSLQPERSAQARIAAVVLNYRTPDETWLAVNSLLASRRKLDDVIVVNNDEVRSSAEVRSSVWFSGPRNLRLIEARSNLGFSGGMNLGIRAALDRGGTHVLLVNSDAIVPPDCVGKLEKCLSAVPDAGIAGPVILQRSDPSRVSSLGLSFDERTGRMRQEGCGKRIVDVPVADSVRVDAVSGCVMLVRREVFEAIGLLDVDYFFSFEDLDLCLKARAAGFATVLAGSARVHHEGGQSIGATSPRRLYFAARNHLLLARRSGQANGRLPALRASSIVALNLALAATSRGGSMPARFGAVLRGTRDYFTGRFGDERR